MRPYSVYVTSTDGTHYHASYKTLAAATVAANKWLGPICTWLGTRRAISMYGDVLQIRGEAGDD